MTSILWEKLNNLLEGVDDVDREISRTELSSELQECLNLEYEFEIVEVRCSRCDKRFRSLPDVKYCTKECELGQTKLPYQTRGQQADFILEAQRGQA